MTAASSESHNAIETKGDDSVTQDPMCSRTPAEIEAVIGAAPAGKSDLRAIDVHVHYLPPQYRAKVVSAGISHPDGFHAGLPPWSAEAHLEQMERLGIETSVVSISTPGVQLTASPADGRLVARAANEEGAELVRDHPGRFGFYAAIPVPDVDGALEEITYAFDTLGAWGVCLLTNTQDVYPGDPRLEPIFAELSRRRSPVLLHPTSPARAVAGVMDGWSRSMYEYFFDSTRTIINLIFSGTLQRNPGVTLIAPHGGAALPALAQRIERNVWRANADTAEHGQQYAGFLDSLRSCYFDLAGSVLPYQLPSLLSMVDTSRIVYGSDYPFTHEELGADLNADLRTTTLLDEGQRQAILRENAFALFPQLEMIGTRA